MTDAQRLGEALEARLSGLAAARGGMQAKASAKKSATSHRALCRAHHHELHRASKEIDW